MQLKHATLTQLRGYLKTANLWKSGLNTRIENVVNGFKCRLSFPPTSHAVVGTSPPVDDAQNHLSIDVIHIEGTNFIHCVDRMTGWSEVGLLTCLDLITLVKSFHRTQIIRQGTPCQIMCAQ